MQFFTKLHDVDYNICPEGGLFLVMSYWGCAAGWGCIFKAGLTIMGSPIQVFSIVLLE